jgi:hypothetical protein
MSENSNAVIPSPTQNPRNSFPAWRLPNGTMNASDANLERASSSCGTWEWGCAAVVVAAIIAEFVIAYIHPPYDSVLNRLGTVAADAAIAIGIVGEVIFGRLDARIQTELRNRSNKQLADAIKTAGEANERAAQLEKFNSWRRISRKQHDAMVSALRGIAPSLDVFIEYQNGDTEAFSLAIALAQIFREAGAAEPHGGPNMQLGIFFGVLVTVHPTVSSEVVSNAFLAGDIGFSIQPYNPIALPKKQPPPNLTIFIAAKPPPPLLSIAEINSNIATQQTEMQNHIDPSRGG